MGTKFPFFNFPVCKIYLGTQSTQGAWARSARRARSARGHVGHVEHVGHVSTLGTPFSRLVLITLQAGHRTVRGYCLCETQNDPSSVTTVRKCSLNTCLRISEGKFLSEENNCVRVSFLIKLQAPVNTSGPLFLHL